MAGALPLRQSTSRVVTIGPFRDYQDGVTLETSVAIASNVTAVLIPEGTIAVIDISTNSWTHLTSRPGYYRLTLGTANTANIGHLKATFTDPDVFLAIDQDFFVLEEDAYDNFYASGAGGGDVSAVLADTEAIITDTENAISERTTLLTDTEAILTDTEALGGGDTALILADTESLVSGQTTILADAEAILADTNELQTDWTNAGRLDAILDAILVDTEAIDVSAIITDTEAILADSEAIITDTEGAGAIATILVDTEAVLADSEASQTSEASILSDTEAVLADSELILADTEGAGAIATILVDTEAILADSEAVLADTELWDSAQSEPSGIPTANAAPLTKLGVLYLMARNKIETTATKKTYYGDDDSAEFEKDLSDDGTTYQETKLNAI